MPALPQQIHLLRELSRHNTFVRYDARGCGLSDWEAEFSFEAWVRDLEAVVEASGSERFPLLGIPPLQSPTRFAIPNASVI